MHGGDNVCYVNIHTYGTLNKVQGKHQTILAFAPQEYSLQSCQRSTDNSNTAARHQERVRLRTKESTQSVPQLFQLIFRQRSGMSVRAHQANDTGDFENAQPFRERNAHKDVSGKKWQSQPDTTVLPSAHGFILGQEELNCPASQML